MTAAKLKEALALLMKGEKYETVAQQYGAAKSTLAYHMHRLGLKKPRANAANASRF